MNIYDIGDMAELKGGPFADITGTVGDPDTVTCRVKDPTGSEIIYTYSPSSGPIVKDYPGNYHLDILITIAGEWSYRWAGSGSITAATEVPFGVRKSAFQYSPNA
jgi:hypothetical protein